MLFQRSMSSLACAIAASEAMPPESLAMAIMQRFKKGTIGTLRTAYDVVSLILAIIIPLIMISKPLFTVREGTVITALCTGLFVDLFMKLLGRPIGIFCNGKEAYESRLCSTWNVTFFGGI